MQSPVKHSSTTLVKSRKKDNDLKLFYSKSDEKGFCKSSANAKIQRNASLVCAKNHRQYSSKINFLQQIEIFITYLTAKLALAE